MHRNLAMTNQVPCHSFQQQQCQYISFRRSRSHSFRGKHHVRSGPVLCFETHLSQTFSFLCILPFESQSVGLSFSSVTYMWCCNMSRIFQRTNASTCLVSCRHENPHSFHRVILCKKKTLTTSCWTNAGQVSDLECIQHSSNLSSEVSRLSAKKSSP